jgi:hypothetical protein
LGSTPDGRLLAPVIGTCTQGRPRTIIERYRRPEAIRRPPDAGSPPTCLIFHPHWNMGPSFGRFFPPKCHIRLMGPPTTLLTHDRRTRHRHIPYELRPDHVTRPHPIAQSRARWSRRGPRMVERQCTCCNTPQQRFSGPRDGARLARGGLQAGHRRATAASKWCASQARARCMRKSSARWRRALFSTSCG